MMYDDDLASRVREMLDGRDGVSERRMFGGLAFLVRGHMAVAASGQGGLMVRVDPAESDRLVRATAARPMEMRGATDARLVADRLRCGRRTVGAGAVGRDGCGLDAGASAQGRVMAGRVPVARSCRHTRDRP